MGARNRVGIGLSYRPARLHRLAELIPWNIPGLHKRLKIRALYCTLHSFIENTEAEFINVLFSLKFLGIILRVLRLEVSVYNVYITNQINPLFKNNVPSIGYTLANI